MKKIYFTLLGLALLTSCNKAEDTKSLEVPTLETVPAAAADPSMPTTYSVPEAQAVQPGVKLNPPHGEPGHVCEIAVGAPLPADGVVQTSTVAPTVVEAAPARPTPIAPSSTSLLNAPINTAVPTGPKPKFNPPHGQPWHDCAIEVGAPLS